MSVNKCCGISCLAGVAAGVCCCIGVNVAASFFELILGMYTYYSSDWIKEHTISIDNGPSQTMKLYEICVNWNDTSTKNCPPIAYEHAFVFMLFMSIILLGVVFGVLKFVKKGWARVIDMLSVFINLGLILTAILFITLAYQSAQIIGEDVVILSGPINLKEMMKIIAGVLVIIFAFVRCLEFIARPKINKQINQMEKPPVATGNELSPPEIVALAEVSQVQNETKIAL